ncbi:hypothetical protein EWM63_28630 [Pseudoduganella lutea]|uniref:DNA/RNA non-specific endonuclease/pyrophosphatase/phosphodiesterase domain-containing protein n=2 Tax=Pseudoduganella lutea TaxID=321985 RepID=A0A4V0Z4C3_9BURK|nr:hypothetical protein EWM63_28630 [Pseudoduganella lutea]
MAGFLPILFGASMTSVQIHVPLTITVSLGDATITPIPVALTQAGPLSTGGLERLDIDPDYAGRRGYDPDFLGVPVPLPVLDDEQRRNAAKNARAREGQDPTVLPYHHFSIVMNRRRQLAYYTAVNIDGAQAKQPKRERDSWHFDPRIAQSEQIGEALYARNALDRGHLVRRLDPAWGVRRYRQTTTRSTSPTARRSTPISTRAVRHG